MSRSTSSPTPARPLTADERHALAQAPLVVTVRVYGGHAWAGSPRHEPNPIHFGPFRGAYESPEWLYHHQED